MADDTSDTPTPAASKPATPRRRAPRKAAAPKAAAPRAAKTKATKSDTSAAPAKKPATKRARATPAKPRATTGRKSASRSESAIDKVGGKWGAAAIAGGVAAIGAAATAALLTLRGSTPKSPQLPAPDGAKKAKAHQPDGKDSSKSFEAKIADENTIPEKA
ncbi:hypothetical protein QP166_06710 [Sphingomonas sp. LR60]|uniref:hypothetical protein n=1 Tax=Sphingomonas sp. LR60 TaxID=3050233 RepID=UPI002FE1A551